MPLEIGALSPKQLLKRQRIVDAAKDVLIAVGPAACTSREIARSGGMNQGLIYYYFSTVDEIIDAAMESLLAELIEGVSHAATGDRDPSSRFWAVLEDYLSVFDRQPQAALVWFEYWTMAARAGQLERVERLHKGVMDLLTTLLEDAGVVDAEANARVLLSYVSGLLIRGTMSPRTSDDLRAEIASLARISGAST